MVEVVEEIISKKKEYKVEIIKRTDGLFSIEILRWFEDEWDERWIPIKNDISIVDTKKHAIEIALEKLRNITGEDIII
ncbi:hypothetical protein H9661_17465 [Clostridium sp. Sa3CVN1]|uniref:Transcriptional coactivator p15 (PC4) C-terminal domain-containing protein n=1 Tax=Clostridium cibarium TaxID=2762247 RepID=A0ABR8PYA3_9CLOT|nr:hypothetical protein [Clostridium cibarium]